MGRIRVLDESVINRIAAGEVVERPASVVKELVENSLDAGAVKISVELKDGGRSLVRVVDDGVGMDYDDALLAIERHATSKIATEKDLVTVGTMGFRGEALASIAAVSRLTLTTREPDAPEGTRLRVVGGKIKEALPAGCPPGTTVSVADLFFNTPARKRFLGSQRTELSHSQLTLLKIAVGRPEVTFELTHEGKRLVTARRGQPTRERLAMVFGHRRAEELLEVEREANGLRVTGLVLPSHISRADSRHLFFYVNGRAVSDALIHRAVMEGFATRLPKGRYPLAAIFLTLDPGLVDVNVHPTKKRVRLRGGGEVFDLVARAVAQALSSLDRGAWRGAGPLEAREEPRLSALADARPEPPHKRPEQAGMEFPGAGGEEPGFFSSLKVLGQVAATYIVAQGDDFLVLIDQHAAHERVMFEELNLGVVPPAQTLVEPLVLDLDPREAEAMERALDPLAALGFDIESFGDRSVLLRALPQGLDTGEAADFIHASLVRLMEAGAEPNPEELMASLRSDLACRAAIKAGQNLTPRESRELLKSLDRLRVSSSCPHGRPLWRKLTLRELAGLFGRTARGPGE